MAKGKIHFNEYNTWDVEKAKRFYAKTAGWTFQDMPTQDPDAKPYVLCVADDAVVAGIFPYTLPMFEGARDFWLTYITVDDADACAAAIVEAGGHVRRQPFQVPGVGRFVVCDDNLGATLGFIEPATA